MLLVDWSSRGRMGYAFFTLIAGCPLLFLAALLNCYFNRPFQNSELRQALLQGNLQDADASAVGSFERSVHGSEAMLSGYEQCEACNGEGTLLITSTAVTNGESKGEKSDGKPRRVECLTCEALGQLNVVRVLVE